MIVLQSQARVTMNMTKKIYLVPALAGNESWRALNYSHQSIA
jgi:hypothetical protein